MNIEINIMEDKETEKKEEADQKNGQKETEKKISQEEAVFTNNFIIFIRSQRVKILTG